MSPLSSTPLSPSANRISAVTADALGQHALRLATHGHTGAAIDAASQALALSGKITVGPMGDIAARAALTLAHWLRADPEPAALSDVAADFPTPPCFEPHCAAVDHPAPDGPEFTQGLSILHFEQPPAESSPPPRTEPPLPHQWLLLCHSRSLLRAGHPREAAQTVEPLTRQREPSVVGALGQLLAAQAWLILGAPARSRRLTAGLSGDRFGAWVEVGALVVQALTADQAGQPGTVHIALSRALATAAPHQLRRPLLDGGPAFGVLMGQHRDLIGDYHPLIGSMIAAGADGRPAGTSPGEWSADDPRVPPTVTSREGEVLRFLPTLLTTNDIATELSVSPNTVKSHLKNLYRKLGVTNRRDAVHHARRLRLL